MGHVPNKGTRAHFLLEQVERLKKENEELAKESVLRGKELEDLNASLTSWKDVVPLEFHQRARIPLDAYISRCTTTTTKNRKYTVRSKRSVRLYC